MSIIHPIMLLWLAFFLIGAWLLFLGGRKRSQMGKLRPIWQAGPGRALSVIGLLIMIASIALPFFIKIKS